MSLQFSKIRGLDKVQAYLKSLPRGMIRVALKAFTEYVLGNQQRGLRHYQPYKYVTRKKAYGQTFKSDAQRRYIMARIREGSIDPGYPHRTGETQRGWHYRIVKGGYGMSIENPTPGAYYTADEAGQARLNALAGWRKVLAVIRDNMAGGLRSATAAVNAYLRSKGK